MRSTSRMARAGKGLVASECQWLNIHSWSREARVRILRMLLNRSSSSYKRNLRGKSHASLSKVLDQITSIIINLTYPFWLIRILIKMLLEGCTCPLCGYLTTWLTSATYANRISTYSDESIIVGTVEGKWCILITNVL